MFPTLRLLQRTRLTTGIHGIPVHPHPLPHLLQTYRSTLSLLSKMPPQAVYRQAAEALTNHRIGIVQSHGGEVEASSEANEAQIEKIEEAIGQGVIEEVVLQAEDEQRLAAKMLEWKP